MEHQSEDPNSYPIQLSVDYPDRSLNRLTTLFRIFVAIPILIVLASVSGPNTEWASKGETMIRSGGASGGILFLPALFLILFRQKYPRWWFDWNLELQRFTTRVGAYLALMDDRYPSTDDHQSVHLDYLYPDVPNDLNRWLPLVKWLLAIPHYIALLFIDVSVIFVVIAVWFVILITGRYPRGLFEFVEGAIRWNSRVVGYAFTLVTDKYPPFSLSA
jgi:hypothetical protein